jgi:hypothetical protein
MEEINSIHENYSSGSNPLSGSDRSDTPQINISETTVTGNTDSHQVKQDSSVSNVNKHDELVRHFQASKERFDTAQQKLHKETEATLSSPYFIFRNWITRIFGQRMGSATPAQNSKLAKAIQEVVSARKNFETTGACLGADQPEKLFNKLVQSQEKISFFDVNSQKVEEAPLESSFKFGKILTHQIEQNQQQDIFKELEKADPFFSMKNSLDRATFSLTDDKGKEPIQFGIKESPDGQSVENLNEEPGDSNEENIKLEDQRNQYIDESFKKWETFVGPDQKDPNKKHLQIAIAFLMNYNAFADFTFIKENEPHNGKYYDTSTSTGKFPTPDPSGPLYSFFLNGNIVTDKSLDISFHLKKTTSDSGAPFFTLIAQSDEKKVFNDNVTHNLHHSITYELQENQAFDTKTEISEKNSPVTLTCLDGGITETFKDERNDKTVPISVGEPNNSVE